MQHALVPRLRFPEFRDGHTWEQRSLGALTVPVAGRVGDSDCVPYTVTSGEGLISQEEKYGRTIAGKSLKSYYRLERDDFAFNKSATKAFPQGYIARFQEDKSAAVPNSIFTCFRIADENVDAVFLDYLFQGNLHGRWLKNYITVGARAHGALNISDDDFYALPIPLPAGDKSLVEQQKIADCLGSLDDLIAAERRNLVALQDHKKGLMQQLFPREGETCPRLRFPKFRDARKWEVQRLEQIAEFQSGGTPSKGNFEYWNGSIPWVSAKDMKHMVLDDTGHHITDAAVEDGAKLVPAGTVLMLTRGMTLLKDVPICLLVRPMSFNQDVRALRPTNGFDGRFLSYLLVGNKQRIRSMVDIAGHGTGRLNTDRLKKLKLLFPPPDEQHRIANCLASLDDLIAAQGEKLDALRAHKRGLMQRLFPTRGHDWGCT